MPFWRKKCMSWYYPPKWIWISLLRFRSNRSGESLIINKVWKFVIHSAVIASASFSDAVHIIFYRKKYIYNNLNNKAKYTCIAIHNENGIYRREKNPLLRLLCECYLCVRLNILCVVQIWHGILVIIDKILRMRMLWRYRLFNIFWDFLIQFSLLFTLNAIHSIASHIGLNCWITRYSIQSVVFVLLYFFICCLFLFRLNNNNNKKKIVILSIVVYHLAILLPCYLFTLVCASGISF